MRPRLVLPLLALLAAGSAGCPGLISALPAVTSAIVEVANVVDTIAAWVDLYFKQRPDPDLERRAQAAVAKTRNAMNAVLRLAEAAKAADDQDVAKAFDDLEAAYKELLELTQPIGVRPEGLASGRASGADGPVLTVPSTLRRPK